MSFLAPSQIISNNITHDHPGLSVIIHPNFIRNYLLASSIKQYSYFSYSVHEALHLSEKEEAMIIALMQTIEQEYLSPIDTFTQKVIIAQIDLLLTYCDQFTTGNLLPVGRPVLICW